MEEIKSLADLYVDMNSAYNEYLKTGEETDLWECCHRVLSLSLFILNLEDEEETFTYEFPKEMLENKKGVIYKLLSTGKGQITKVSTIPCEGVVWFETSAGEEIDDDCPELTIWEIFNIATALYKMTEPLATLLYN